MVEYLTNTDLVILASHISYVGQCEFILNAFRSSHRICSPPDLDSPHLTLTPVCWRLCRHKKVIWNSRSWSVDENNETSHYCGLPWARWGLKRDWCAAAEGLLVHPPPKALWCAWISALLGRGLCWHFLSGTLGATESLQRGAHLYGWFSSPVSLQRVFQVGRDL